MIRYTKGDLLRADVDALVNTVNCVGIMGRGVACNSRRRSRQTLRNTKMRATGERLSLAVCS